MYIAFKWLVVLTLFMWLLTCGIDVSIRTLKKGIYLKEVEDIYKNVSVPVKSPPKRGVMNNKASRSKNHRMYGVFNFGVLFAAGFLILIISNKQKIILHLTKKINNIEGSNYYEYLNSFIYLKRRLIIICNATSSYLSHGLGNVRRKIKNSPINHGDINRALLKKLKDVADEKKKLYLLLAAYVFENRNMKINYKLEIMAKKRLEQYTEDTDRKMKEALSEKIHLQHLYLITFQENVELQARIKRLMELREHAERNLISLVHEVCMSRNKQLMAYCSRFVVQTKDNLLRSDMKSEIRQFLKSNDSIAQIKTLQRPEVDNNTKLCTKSFVSEGSNTFTPSVSNAPSLAGLNGEHIWTVKDGDGFIEKIYQCNLTTDFNDGGTIRRIREYSVYHDKDSFLKTSNFSSRTRIHENNCLGENFAKELEKLRGCNKIQNHRFVTGSEAFKIFLKNYRNLNIHSEKSQKIPISYK